MTFDDSLKLENQLCFPLYTAGRKITASYTPYLKPLGLTYTQYIVFMVLWEQEEITVGELGKKLYLDSGTLTPLLKKMEANGWLARSRSDDDERVVNVVLSEAGKKMKEACKDIPASIGRCVPLQPQEAMQLYGLLYKIIEAF